MFTQKMLDFIAENYWRSDRVWFAEHKNVYREFVQKPLIALTEFLTPTVVAADWQIITEPKVAVSRIYRDMRYVRDGLLYRDCMWISFKRDKHAYPCWPEFYLVVTPQESFYGCGYYETKTDVMTAMREMILDEDPKFRAAQDVLEHHPDFQLDGKMYLRSRYGQYPEPLRTWLDRRTVCIERKLTSEELFSEHFSQQIRDDFIAMTPLYAFFLAAEAKAEENR